MVGLISGAEVTSSVADPFKCMNNKSVSSVFDSKLPLSRMDSENLRDCGFGFAARLLYVT